MKDKKMGVNNKQMCICLIIWLLSSFTIGMVFARYINIDFLNEVYFVKVEMVNQKENYRATMACLFLLFPFAFAYMYKYCIFFVKIEKRYLWTVFLGIFLGVARNSGYITINYALDNHYKYDLLFRYIVYKADWIGAVLISFVGLYMTTIFGATLLAFFYKRESK